MAKKGKEKRAAKIAAKKAIPQTAKAPQVHSGVVPSSPKVEFDLLDEEDEVNEYVANVADGLDELLDEGVDEEVSEENTGVGVVLDTVKSGTKLMFTKICTTNPENGKVLSIIHYRPEVERAPMTTVKFKFGTHSDKGREKLTAVDVVTTGSKSELADLATQIMKKPPTLREMYVTDVLMGLVSAADPIKYLDAIGIVGINCDKDLFYVTS